MQQLPLIKPDTNWCTPSEYPRLTDEKILSWDIETSDPNLTTRGPGWSRNDGFIAGIGIGTEDRQWYFPIAHQGGGNLNRDMTIKFAKDLLKLDTKKLVFNGPYDFGWLRTECDVELGGQIWDALGAAALVDENRFSYTLNSLLGHYCGEYKDDKLLKEAASAWGVDAYKGLWKLPAPYVGPYCENDVRDNWLLWRKVEPLLREQDMWPLFEMEMDLYPCWDSMTRRGVRIDEDWIAQSRESIVKQCEDIYKIIGKVDIWNSNQIAVLLAKDGVTDIPKTPKTKKPSITAEWLASLNTNLSKNILRARRLEKVKGTFIDGMIIDHLTDGRIHPDWHPLRRDDGAGAVSGRVTAGNPSPQVFPKRDPEFGMMLRGAFLPEEGEEWMSADYAQQEPRWFVHFSAAIEIRGVQEMLKAYNTDPRTDYHTLCAKMAGLERAHAKDLNQGLAYGMGRKRSVNELMALGIDRAAAEEVYDKFHEKLPYVQNLNDRVVSVVSRRGWVKTILGRRFHFDTWEPKGNYQSNEDYVTPQPKWKASKLKREGADGWKAKPIQRAFMYKAPNRIIQGSSADQVKLAMLNLWKSGDLSPSLLLQVHDELNLSNGKGEKGRALVIDAMENATEALVPFVVDVTIGERWMASK